MEAKKIIQFSLVILTVVVLLTLANTNTGFAQPKPTATEWNIPFLSVLTGPVAFAGVPAVWGAEYAAKQINNAGGIRGVSIKFTKYDTAFNTAKAVSAMSKAVEGSMVVFGPMDGPGGEAAGPLAAEARVADIAAFSFPEVRERLKPWGIAYMQDSPDGSALASAEWLKLNSDIKSIAVFYMPADPAQVDEYKLVEAGLKKLRINILGPIEVQTGQLDMGPAVVKAMNFKPDGYFCILRTGEYTKVAIELYNRGMTEGRRICATFAAMSPALLEVGKDKLNNTYIWDKMDSGYPDAKWQTLIEAYKGDHSGQLPMINTIPNYYDAVYAVKAAFEAKQITGDSAKLADERKKIADFLFNSQELDGIQGKFKWLYGKKVAPYHFFQIRDNKLVKINVLGQ
jgi:branched-chain amino acid transport system substrate-binding protein